MKSDANTAYHSEATAVSLPIGFTASAAPVLSRGQLPSLAVSRSRQEVRLSLILHVSHRETKEMCQ